MEIVIEPAQGIGQIKLGMTKDKVQECIQYYTKFYKSISLTNNLFDYFFKIEYNRNGEVCFIEVPCNDKGIITCKLKDIDITNTQAEELIAKINSIEKYDEDKSTPDTYYYFKSLGLSLWRSMSPSDVDIQDQDWFKELSPEEKEAETSYLYFESVSISSPDYYSQN
ncbi:hypothetical protein [Paenibacillus agilis]|uniref:Uncharacterized protein n=1 Tax=Paenibacillus agilis TaxID=3020863 RepID=A0A559J2F3_9BACL|nr:hypothetical protein [Paenibacillus agilis]TVX94065.1 hypothetical protein FPZ44_13970 [Paenibacillus agilis]